VYRDPRTGAERPVDSPGPQWFAAKTRLQPGRPYSQAAADEDLAAFVTEHRMLCREVRPEPVPGGVRVVFVFERRPRAWTVRVAARPGAPSVGTTELMEEAVRLRREEPVSAAAVNADKWAITRHLRADGYHFASVVARIDPVENRPGYVDVTFEVDRGPKVQPECITFTGNEALSRDELLDLMGTREDRWWNSRRFVEEKLGADVENIRRRYLGDGWEDVQVTLRPVLFDPERVTVSVCWKERGGRRVVTRLRVSGARAVSPRAARRQFLCRPGSAFSRERFRRDIAWLKDRYYAAGYRPAEDEPSPRSEAEDGRGRVEAELVFARAREVVTLDISVAQDPDGTPRVARVTVRATGPYPDSEVRALLSRVQRGLVFTEEALLADVAAVSAHYTQPGPEHGYALVDERMDPGPDGCAARLEFVKKDPADRSVAAHIHIDIREQERYVVESITFEGVSRRIFEDHMRDRLRMRRGSLFTRADLAADGEAVRTAYQEKGYADVRVSCDDAPGPGENTYRLTYVVDEGPVYYVDIIRPRGNDRTKPFVVTREMAIRPGERYDIRKIEESHRRLRNTGHFTDVAIRPADSRRPPEDGRAYKELHVLVREADTRHLFLGLGAGSATGVFGDLRFQDTNFDISDPPESWSDFVSGSAFGGGGQFLSVFIQPGSKVSQYGIEWHDPWFREQPLEFTVAAGYFSRDWDEYTVTRLGSALTLGRRFQRTLTGFITFRGHAVDLDSVDFNAPPDVWDDEGEEVVFGLGVGITRNTVDNKFFPTSGKKWTLMAELIGVPFLDALKLMAEGRWYRTICEKPDKSRHVLSFWGDVGMLVGSDLPVYERFYAGGPGSVRGFADHGISPLNKNVYVNPRNKALGKVPVRHGDPIGGQFKMEGGVEYYFPILKDSVRGVLFLDAGSVAKSSFGAGSAFSDLRIATGIGTHIRLPALGNAPIAAYLGVPLKKESGDDTEAFTFSIGLLLP